MAILLMLLLAGCASQNGGGDQGEEGELRNSQTYYDVMDSFERDTPVMVFLLDGLGYMQYEEARELGIVDYITDLGDIEKAEAYMPSISPVGLAAIVTGAGPDQNGVEKRGDMELRVPDMFENAVESGKKAVLIEGDAKLINTFIEPILNVDSTGDGLTDDEVFNCAMNYIGGGYDLVFIHFHGIDDVAHLYGPMSVEAMDRVKLIDGYVETLCSGWSGAVIITADHGLHQTDNGGAHGTEAPEDMYVPYLYKR